MLYTLLEARMLIAMNINISANCEAAPFLKVLRKTLEDLGYDCLVKDNERKARLRVVAVPLSDVAVPLSDDQKIRETLSKAHRLVKAAEKIALNVRASQLPIEGVEEIVEAIYSGTLTRQISEELSLPEGVVWSIVRFFLSAISEFELSMEIKRFLKD